MKQLILLSGLPGSGKSTFCKDHFDNSYIIISSDEIRKEMTSSYDKFPNDMFDVYNEMIKRCNECLKHSDDINIILDSTFLDDERRNYFITRISGYTYLKLIMLKAHNLETIFNRNQNRIKEKWVPKHVIEEMNQRFNPPAIEYENLYNKIEVIYID